MTPDYDQGLALLRELHVLMVACKGDSPEADAIRDRMDDIMPWHKLTDVQRQALTAESERLDREALAVDTVTPA